MISFKMQHSNGKSVTRSLSLFFVLLLLLVPLASAQDGTIKGTIRSDDGERLAGVNVFLEGTERGAATNGQGIFSIGAVPAGEYTITGSMVGFGRASRLVTVRAGDTLHVSLVLWSLDFMPEIEVIGRRPEQLLRIPGAASVVTDADIRRTAPLSGNEVLRKVSGVHAVDEEGAGLRANIGIRGLDPDRSRTVLVMEDGIPVALAPYGEPEMYYTPSIDRMAGIEIVKGSGSILYGPQTFGGVINYLTASPPAVSTADIHIRGGEHGFFIGRFGYGTTVGRTGLQVTYVRRQADQLGMTGFTLNDLNAKVRHRLGDASFIGLKLAAYDEVSNSTYVGLTQHLFDSGYFDFVHPAPDDELRVRRYSLSATHDHFITPEIRIQTTAFGYMTVRDWSRQDFDVAPAPDRIYARIFGDSTVEGGALYFRGTTGNRNREFHVAGLEPKLSASFAVGAIENEFDAGFRVLFERAFEQRINGILDAPLVDEVRDDEVRTGYATSLFLQNRVFATPQFSVTPGIRVEAFTYERDIRRLEYQSADIVSRDNLMEFLPGLGLNYRLFEGSAVFAGVHRGFGPPRIKDALSSTGRSQELGAERSWNYELGTRMKISDVSGFEMTGYYMDFSNQVIPVSESAGGPGSVPEGVGLVNGGATRHLGLETAFHVNLGERLIGSGYTLSLQNNITFSSARFSADRYIIAGDNLINIKGHRLPYAPPITFSGLVDFETPRRSGLRLTGTYVGDQYGDVLNSVEGSPDGRAGRIEDHMVFDLVAGYSLPAVDGLRFNVSIKNIFNERYIVSRRPQGIRLGVPRFLSAGFDWNF